MNEITVDQWRAALLEAMKAPAGAEGQSVRELMESTGMAEERIHSLIRKLQEQGRVVVHRGLRMSIDGRRATVPVYLLVESGRVS